MSSEKSKGKRKANDCSDSDDDGQQQQVAKRQRGSNTGGLIAKQTSLAGATIISGNTVMGNGKQYNAPVYYYNCKHRAFLKLPSSNIG